MKKIDEITIKKIDTTVRIVKKDDTIKIKVLRL